MAGAGIRPFAKLRGQMPGIATTGITFWQTALKHTAECQPPLANILQNANSLVKFDHGMPQTEWFHS
jgi:hypothetical protein